MADKGFRAYLENDLPKADHLPASTRALLEERLMAQADTPELADLLYFHHILHAMHGGDRTSFRNVRVFSTARLFEPLPDLPEGIHRWRQLSGPPRHLDAARFAADIQRYHPLADTVIEAEAVEGYNLCSWPTRFHCTEPLGQHLYPHGVYVTNQDRDKTKVHTTYRFPSLTALAVLLEHLIQFEERWTFHIAPGEVDRTEILKTYTETGRVIGCPLLRGPSDSAGYTYDGCAYPMHDMGHLFSALAKTESWTIRASALLLFSARTFFQTARVCDFQIESHVVDGWAGHPWQLVQNVLSTVGHREGFLRSYVGDLRALYPANPPQALLGFIEQLESISGRESHRRSLRRRRHRAT